jgi:hypothetical protein
MKPENKISTPTFHELWEVNQAAAKLTNHACAISARHLKNGVTRSIFNREVAYYARSIVKDVEQGKKSIAQGLMEIKTEQRSLSNQSREIALKGLGGRCWRYASRHRCRYLLRLSWDTLPYRRDATDGTWGKQPV